MAIRIPILTSFDPKGLKQANASFAKLQSSVGSLGRNFAVAGAAIAAAGALIAKNAQSLARIEQINAQTAQTIKSMGNAAGISASEVEKLSGSLEALTATEAESIQEGANLLLTFGNIRNQLGAGNDIFTQTTKIMVDLGVALKRGPVQTATMLGKALNDPIKGLTALTRVGVSFSEQQKDQVKALQQSGDLMGAQRVILAELQRQYGGSGAAFAQTFNGQLQLMGHELGTIGEEATMAVMPALQGMVEQLRELIPIIGPQLKAAIESVDWKALVQSVVDFTKFMVENGATIAKVIAGIFILNTAYKALAVATGIAKVATDLYKWSVAQAAAGMTIATVATNIFTAALRLIPFVAVATGIGLIIAGIMEADSSYRTTTPVVTSFGTALLKSGQDAEWAASKYGVATTAAINLAKAELNVGRETSARKNQLNSYLSFLDKKAGGSRPGSIAPEINTSSAGKAAKAVKKNQVLNKKQQKLMAEQDRWEAKHARAQTAIAQEQAQALEERERTYTSFVDSIKTTFAGIKDSLVNAFDLGDLGGSTNAITRNMDQLLTRMRSFASNIRNLAGMGLDPALLQQVISAGPMAGAKLAQSLVAGGAGALATINAGYAEFGSLSSEIAQTGTAASFGSAKQESIYNISVNGGVGSGATIGKAIVEAIKSYERTSGAVWQGA